jgi:hypothetical protein
MLVQLLLYYGVLQPIRNLPRFPQIDSEVFRSRFNCNRQPWPAHRVRRVRRQRLARYQPIEQHADAGEMLLNRWRFRPEQNRLLGRIELRGQLFL